MLVPQKMEKLDINSF